MGPENLNSKIDNLNSIYDLLLTSGTPRSFFINLFKYIEFIDKDNALTSLIEDYVIKFGRKDQNKLNRLTKKAISRFDKVYYSIKPVTDKMAGGYVKHYRSYYEAYLNGSVESTSGPARGRHSYLIGLMDTLLNSEDKKLVIMAKPFAIYEEGRFIAWTFSEILQDLDSEERRIDRLKKTAIWYHWDCMAYVYNIYKDVEKYKEEAWKNHKGLAFSGLGVAEKELKGYLDNKLPDDKVTYFDYEELQENIKQFHFDFSQILSRVSSKNYEKDSKIGVIYNQDTGELVANGKYLRFKIDSFNDFVISSLYKSKGKELYRGELLKEYEGREDLDLGSTTYKNKLYQACEHINSRVASKLGVMEFLRFTKDTVKSSLLQQ